ncbi:sigma factor-like helix-turn-helix DNA-binding protein [Amycolatopsis sp. NPDC051758]|uniref:sigma factor-like helix-turn-helix DNA-binding protein n=1 Tax=Amycolatopsis sp. NPDC051758 TaxID=3363935 RepID=UPI0037B61296
MTRRRVTVLDGSRYAAAILALDQLKSVLETISPDEAEIVILRYGLRDGVPHSRAETAKILGFSGAEVLRREADAFRRIRRPLRSSVLRDYLDSDQATVPDQVRARIMGGADGPAVDRCERHGYFELAAGSALCSECPCPVTPARSVASDLGRPRRYCSDACRQASYRARKAKPVS